jgi:hypothetical protein
LQTTTDDTMTEGMTGPGTTIDEMSDLGTMTDGTRGLDTTTGEVEMIDESKLLGHETVAPADWQVPTR